MIKFNNYRNCLFSSLGVHLLVLGVFVVSFGSSAALSVKSEQKTEIVKAVAVNQQDLEKEIAKVAQEKADQKKAEALRVAKQKQKLADAKRQQKQAQEKLDKLKKIEEEHQKTIAMTQKKAKAQEEAAKKKQAELEQLEKKLAAKKAEEKRQAEEAKKRKLAELQKKRKEELEKALKEEMQSENQELSKAAEARINKEVDKYKAIIVSAISRSWLVPPQVKKNASCQLLVKIGPGGVVLDVKTLKSSGDPVLDRSARTAVQKASPLPVPESAELFDRFRELKLTVRPEKIVSR